MGKRRTENDTTRLIVLWGWRRRLGRNMFTCEIDDFCNKVLDYWFPNTERYHDIKKTDFSKWRGKIDVLSGGPPCQAVSVAGKRKGDKDDRFLWDEFIRAVREIKPAWIVAENVYGILSMVESGETPHVEREDSLFGEIDEEGEWVSQRYVLYNILSEIENEGYETLPIVIPACAVGAPHERKRVWIICHRVDADAEGEPWEPRDGGEGDDKSRGFGGVYRENALSNADGTGLQAEGTEQPATGSTGDGLRRTSSDTVIAGIEGLRKREINSSGSQVSTNPDGELVEGRDEEANEKRERENRLETFGSPRGWESFPSVSPVCGRDDGLSGRLDGITFSRWRKESIKAYGNAWCVPVAYEIFRILDKYIKTNKWDIE